MPDDPYPTLRDESTNGYDPPTPRAALALTAVALAAVSLGAVVVLPAKLDTHELTLNIQVRAIQARILIEEGS